MSFFDKISQGWSFIKEALAMGFRERSLLKPSIYLVVTTIVYYAIWVAVILQTNVDFESNQGKILGAACVFGSFLIFFFFCGMTVNMVDAYLKGGRPSVGDAFKDAVQNFFAIMMLALISTLVELLAKAARRRDNIVGSILASIIETVWTVLSFLLLPAIIIEDIGLGAALKRARDISKGNLLMIGVGEVGVRFVTGIISFLVTIAIVALVYVGFAVIGGTAGVVVAFVVGGTLFALLAAFTTFVRMAYYTCLYIWAAETEKVGKGAEAPGPLKAVMG